MIFAIIAAGAGSRLQQEGATISKPLVSINGQPLIGRLIDIFVRNGASEIFIIVNEKMSDVRDFFQNYHAKIPLHVLSKSTPSSLHSFYELTRTLPREKFCLTTVDTVFNDDEFSTMIQSFEKNDSQDGIFGVTDFVDDEKPLFVETDDEMRISGFYDEKQTCKFVSGGIYCLTERVFDIMNDCMQKDIARMRNFQRFLLENNFKINAFRFSKIIDIDHVSDIEKAAQFIAP